MIFSFSSISEIVSNDTIINVQNKCSIIPYFILEIDSIKRVGFLLTFFLSVNLESFFSDNT